MSSKLAGRYAAVDVHYPADGSANAAMVVAADRTFSSIVDEYTAHLPSVPPYQPGAFFLRELPALRAVFAQAGVVDLVVVDGYVDLDPNGRPGLGAHVHHEMDVPVVGVAKTAFHSATHAVEVRRGGTRPLYVTAAGLPLDEAAALVQAMAGSHRLPDALRRVDSLARA
ncbi:endonuclease V [Micromonospora sp. CPCC 206061]|uniref:endonuclease V n=1 Tax=Micromonospora sp. CPCC 206061 TaxID=3122410 RepID=UPI002FEE739C